MGVDWIEAISIDFMCQVSGVRKNGIAALDLFLNRRQRPHAFLRSVFWVLSFLINATPHILQKVWLRLQSC